jgi:putative transposase
MKKSKFSEEQIAYALRQADGGTPVGDVCRQLGVSEATFYVWKKKYGQLGLSELREIRQLRDENARLKRLVADLTLDKHILSEVLRKKSEADTTATTGVLDSGDLPGKHRSFVSAGSVHPRGLVSEEYGPRPDCSGHAHPRSRPCAAAVRLSADYRAAAA